MAWAAPTSKQHLPVDGEVRPEPGSHARIYAVVARIPRARGNPWAGRAAGEPARPRLVGYALAALDEGSRIPWHRVVNARGGISLRSDDGPAGILQRLCLERERVVFDAKGRIPLERFRWRPRLRAS
jgi:methylated-DNA-protein-cysteine methyltransferase-like protein